MPWPPAFKINRRPACDDDKGFSCVCFPSRKIHLASTGFYCDIRPLCIQTQCLAHTGNLCFDPPLSHSPRQTGRTPSTTPALRFAAPDRGQTASFGALWPRLTADGGGQLRHRLEQNTRPKTSKHGTASLDRCNRHHRNLSSHGIGISLVGYIAAFGPRI